MRLDIHVHDGVTEAIERLHADMRRGLIAILTNQGAEVTALEDLQAADAALASVVTDLVAGIDRLDTDFAALQDAIATGDSAAIAVEAANVQAAVAALSAAKDRIDVTDPAPAPAPVATVDVPAEAAPADEPTQF